MADDVLAQLSIDVTADLSDLSDKLGQAVDDVQKAGQEMAQAMDFDWSDVTSGLDKASAAATEASGHLEAVGHAAQEAGSEASGAAGELGGASEGLRGVGEAAQHLTPKLNDVHEGVKHVGEAAEESGGLVGYFTEGLGELASQALKALALVEIVRTLKEMGEASLEAADGWQHANAAMTVFTGSAEAAAAQLEQVEEIAQRFAVPVAAMEKAAVVMDGFKLSASHTSALLKDAAAASQVFGTSVETASRMIGSMVANGTLMTRSLSTLGTSLSQLAQIMGVSADQVTAKWKTMTETQRFDVLNKALEKTRAAGEAASNSIGGMATQMANDFEKLGVSVGQALTPLIAQLRDFMSSNIVPFLEQVVGGFKELLSAVGPSLATAFKSITLLIEDAGSDVAALIRDIAKLSGASLGGFIQTITQMADGLRTALNATTALANAVTEFASHLAASVWQPAIEGLSKLGVNMNSGSAAGKAFAASMSQLHSVLQGLAQGGPVGAFLVLVGQMTDTLNKNRATITAYLEALRLIEPAFAADIDAAEKLLNVFDKTGPAVSKLGDDVKKVGESVDTATQTFKSSALSLAELTQKYNEHNATLKQAKEVLAQAQAAYDKAKASGVGLAQAQELLVAAQNQLITAYQKADPLLKSHAANVTELHLQYQQAEMRVTATKVALDAATAAYARATPGTQAAAEALAVLVKAQQDHTKALQDADPLVKLHITSLQAMENAYKENQLRVDEARKVVDQAIASLVKAREASGDLTDKVQVFNGILQVTHSRVIDVAEALDTATRAVNKLTGEHLDNIKALGFAEQALRNYITQLKLQNEAAGIAVPTVKLLGAEYDETKIALEQAVKVENEAQAAYDGSAKAAEVLRQAKEKVLELELKLNPALKNTTASVREHTQSLHDNASATTSLTGVTQNHIQTLMDFQNQANKQVRTLMEMRNGTSSLTSAIEDARLEMEAARAAVDGSDQSLITLNLATKQYNDLVKELNGLAGQQVVGLEKVAGAYDDIAAAAGKAGKAEQSASGGHTTDQSGGPLSGMGQVNLDTLMAMFGGYGKYEQNHPGENGITINGVFNGSYINPGTLTPATTSQSSPASSSAPGSSTSGTSTAFQNTAGLTGPDLIAQAFADAMSQGNTGASFEDAVLTLEKAGYSFQAALDALDSVARSLNTTASTLGTAATVMTSAAAATAQASAAATTQATAAATAASAGMTTAQQVWDNAFQQFGNTDKAVASALDTLIETGETAQQAASQLSQATGRSISATNSVAPIFSAAAMNMSAADQVWEDAVQEFGNTAKAISKAMDDLIASGESAKQAAAELSAASGFSISDTVTTLAPIGVGSYQGSFLGASGPPSSAPTYSPYVGSGPSGLTLQVNLNGGMIVGTNGMNQFTDMMMQKVVSKLSTTAGLKVR